MKKFNDDFDFLALPVDFFDDERIKLIEKGVKNSDSILLYLIKLIIVSDEYGVVKVNEKEINNNWLQLLKNVGLIEIMNEKNEIQILYGDEE